MPLFFDPFLPVKLFVNDTPVEILDAHQFSDFSSFDCILDARQVALTEAKLKDDVLVTHATDLHIKQCLDAFTKKKVKKLNSITFLVKDRRATIDGVKQQFKVIEAAGGVVVKDQQLLMIFRLGKWDLPKGKLEGKEKPLPGGIREVEEECNVQVLGGPKICHTWHTYTRNKRKILKKTYWFAMSCTDDSAMRGQADEGITEVRWMSYAEAQQALYNSYVSIRYVLRRYFEQQDTL